MDIKHVRIPLSSILVTESYQPRVDGTDEKLAQSYADDIKAGAIFPAVKLFGEEDQPVHVGDGFTRILGHKFAGRRVVDAELRPGGYREAKLWAMGSNGQHGGRRKRKDLRASIREALLDEEWRGWTDGRIAAALKTTDRTVGTVRGEMEEAGQIPQTPERIGLDGKTYPVAYPDPGPKISDLDPPDPHPIDRHQKRVKQLSDAAEVKVTKKPSSAPLGPEVCCVCKEDVPTYTVRDGGRLAETHYADDGEACGGSDCVLMRFPVEPTPEDLAKPTPRILDRTDDAALLDTIEAAYSADKIYSGRISKPVELDGTLWTNTGGQSQGGLWLEFTLRRLHPAGEGTPQADGTPYTGMEVAYRGTAYVIGPESLSIEVTGEAPASDVDSRQELLTEIRSRLEALLGGPHGDQTQTVVEAGSPLMTDDGRRQRPIVEVLPLLDRISLDEATAYLAHLHRAAEWSGSCDLAAEKAATNRTVVEGLVACVAACPACRVRIEPTVDGEDLRIPHHGPGVMGCVASTWTLEGARAAVASPWWTGEGLATSTAQRVSLLATIDTLDRLDAIQTAGNLQHFVAQELIEQQQLLRAVVVVARSRDALTDLRQGLPVHTYKDGLVPELWASKVVAKNRCKTIPSRPGILSAIDRALEALDALHAPVVSDTGDDSSSIWADVSEVDPADQAGVMGEEHAAEVADSRDLRFDPWPGDVAELLIDGERITVEFLGRTDIPHPTEPSKILRLFTLYRADVEVSLFCTPEAWRDRFHRAVTPWPNAEERPIADDSTEAWGLFRQVVRANGWLQKDDYIEYDWVNFVPDDPPPSRLPAAEVPAPERGPCPDCQREVGLHDDGTTVAHTRPGGALCTPARASTASAPPPTPSTEPGPSNPNLRRGVELMVALNAKHDGPRQLELLLDILACTEMDTDDWLALRWDAQQRNTSGAEAAK